MFSVALEALKRKKMHEAKLKKIDSELIKLDYQLEALENDNDALCKNETSKLINDITKQQELADEIATAISSAIDIDAELDESDLLKELELFNFGETKNLNEQNNELN